MNIMFLIDPASIFQMRLVSKNWYDSIMDDEFVKEHNKESKLRRQRHFLVCKIGADFWRSKAFYTMSRSYIAEEELNLIKPHPILPHVHRFDLVGTIDGLICMQHISQTNVLIFYICNPSTGQNITVMPQTTMTSKCIIFLHVYILLFMYLIYLMAVWNKNFRNLTDLYSAGFAFNSESKDYSIIILWRNNLRIHETWMSKFTTSSMQWSLPVLTVYDVGLLYTKNVHLDGSIYWLADLSNIDRAFGQNILCFNSKTNSFHTIRLPEWWFTMQWHISVMDNRLAAASSNIRDSIGGALNIWLKNGTSNERDGWLHLYSLQPTIMRSKFLGFSGGKCIFFPKDFSLGGGQYKTCPSFIYEDVAEKHLTKKITSPIHYNYVIDNLVDFYPSLTRF